MHIDNKIGSICCYLSLLSTFPYAFPPRAESATFSFATMFASRCAISGFVYLGQKNHNMRGVACHGAGQGAEHLGITQARPSALRQLLIIRGSATVSNQPARAAPPFGFSKDKLPVVGGP